MKWVSPYFNSAAWIHRCIRWTGVTNLCLQNKSWCSWAPSCGTHEWRQTDFSFCHWVFFWNSLAISTSSRLTRFLSVCVPVLLLGSLQETNKCFIVWLIQSERGEWSPPRNVRCNADSSLTVVPMHIRSHHHAWTCYGLVPSNAPFIKQCDLLWTEKFLH